MADTTTARGNRFLEFVVLVTAVAVLAFSVLELHLGPTQAFAGEATIKRAVVVAANCIVDISVTYYRDDGPAVPDDLAEKVAQVSLERIDAA